MACSRPSKLSLSPLPDDSGGPRQQPEQRSRARLSAAPRPLRAPDLLQGTPETPSEPPGTCGAGGREGRGALGAAKPLWRDAVPAFGLRGARRRGGWDAALPRRGTRGRALQGRAGVGGGSPGLVRHPPSRVRQREAAPTLGGTRPVPCRGPRGRCRPAGPRVSPGRGKRQLDGRAARAPPRSGHLVSALPSSNILNKYKESLALLGSIRFDDGVEPSDFHQSSIK